jgi:hypothetical protein
MIIEFKQKPYKLQALFLNGPVRARGKMSQVQEVQKTENKEVAPELIFSYLATTHRSVIYELFGDVSFDIENAVMDSDKLTVNNKVVLAIELGRILESFITLRELENVAYIMGAEYYSRVRDLMVDTIRKLIVAYFATYYGRPYSEIDNKLTSIRESLRVEINYLIDELYKKIIEKKSKA